MLTAELPRAIGAGIQAQVETALFNLPAFLIAIAVTALLVRGIRESANFNSVVVLVKIGVVLLFIIAGVGYVNTRITWGWGASRASGIACRSYRRTRACSANTGTAAF